MLRELVGILLPRLERFQQSQEETVFEKYGSSHYYTEEPVSRSAFMRTFFDYFSGKPHKTKTFEQEVKFLLDGSYESCSRLRDEHKMKTGNEKGKLLSYRVHVRE